MRSLILPLALALLAAAPAYADIQGRIRLAAPAPDPASVDMSSDPFCFRRSPHARAQSLRVSEGGLQDVFIHLVRPEAPPRPAPLTAAHLTARDCTLEPRVLGVQAGQRVTLASEDQTLHALRIHDAAGTQDRRLPKAGMAFEHRFTRPQVMARITCDVHPWMQAFVGVVAHPYFAVTDETGRFQIPTEGLPDGRYPVALWHEVLGTRSATVAVSGGEGRLELTWDSAP